MEAERAAVCNVQASGSQEGTLLGGKWYPDTAKSTSEQVPSRTFPSPEAVAAADGFVLDELYEAFELIRSYAVSGMEAAGRGDRDDADSWRSRPLKRGDVARRNGMMPPTKTR